MQEVYQVAGWIKHHSSDHTYWAEFGSYPTLDAAHRAARTVAAPGCSISIILHRQTVATYQDSKLVNADPYVPSTP